MTALTGFCPTCGRELSRAARYCPGCGGKVTSLAERGHSCPPGPPLATGSTQPQVQPHPPAARSRLAAGASALPSSVPPIIALANLPPSPAGPLPPLLPGMVELRGDSRLAQMDAWLDRRLELDVPARNLKEPAILSESAQEFYGGLLSGEPLSPGQWRTLLEQQLKEAREHAEHGGGVWGAFLAGQACLINGWLFKEVFGLAQPRDALADARTAGLLLGTVAHEKWGHGFLSATTALGAETRQVQMDRLRYARLFSGFQVTTPEGVILREKWRAVYNATRFAEEGWSSWIENLVRRGFNAQGTGGAAAAPALWMQNFVVPELRQRNLAASQQALLTLFDPSRNPDEAKAAMAVLEQTEDELTPYFMGQYGRPPRYIIGYGLCWLIERRFGERNVPAALILAGNVVYGLATQGASDVANVIASSPDLNVNRRLAAIAHLPRKDSPGLSRRDFAAACHDLLGLNIPANLKA